MRLDALTQRRVPTGRSVNTRDALFRLVHTMDLEERRLDEQLITDARSAESRGLVLPGSVDRALSRGVGEPVSILLVAAALALAAIAFGAGVFAWDRYLARRPAIDIAAANAAAQATLLNAEIAVYERQAAATPPGGPRPTPPSVPGIPNPPQQPGFGTEIAKATSGLALLLAVGAGIFILARGK